MSDLLVELFEQLAQWSARGIETVGILVILIGGAFATGHFVRCLAARNEFDGAFHTFRSNLGRAILLGLEFLVAGDIIGTVAVEPTFQNLGVLALIVLIRTFLSFALEVEINGHWPWKATEFREEAEPPAPL